MNSRKFWLRYLIAILTLATIVANVRINDFLAKLVKRLVPESQTGGE